MYSIVESLRLAAYYSRGDTGGTNIDIGAHIEHEMADVGDEEKLTSNLHSKGTRKQPGSTDIGLHLKY